MLKYTTMEKMKYSVARYNGIGDSPMVILLGMDKGSFTKQFNTVEELILEIGIDAKIYKVSDINGDTVDALDNWIGGNFDFNKLSEIEIKYVKSPWWESIVEAEELTNV